MPVSGKMSKRPVRPFSESRLIGLTWTFPDVGRVRLVDSEPEHWEEADRDWPETRPSKSLNTHWKWKKLMSGKFERASVLNEADEVLALWCSGAESPLALPSGDYYRLDVFEIAPRLRKGTFGVQAFALIATRAAELACAGLVLAALPGLEGVYSRYGGSQQLVFGWKADSSLVPFLFDKKSLTYLVEQVDDYLDEV